MLKLDNKRQTKTVMVKGFFVMLNSRHYNSLYVDMQPFPSPLLTDVALR